MRGKKCIKKGHKRTYYKSGKSDCLTCKYKKQRIKTQHPDYKKRRAVYALRYRYGTEEIPSGDCQICRVVPAKTQDHNHNTGEARGFLCHKCNILLAGLDRPEWLKLAKNYLKRYK